MKKSFWFIICIFTLTLSVFFTGSAINTVAQYDETTEEVERGNRNHTISNYPQKNDEWYAPLVDALADFEKSGYTVYDSDLLGTSLWLRYGNVFFEHDFVSDYWLTYALYYINSDGIMELIIGAASSYGHHGPLVIYTLHSGMPTMVIQEEFRHNLFLLIDDTGSVIIQHSRGHMGAATEFFLSMSEDGSLTILNIFFTLDYIWDNDLETPIGYTRGKAVDEYINSIYLDEHLYRTMAIGDDMKAISNEEYLSLLHKYGGWGYGLRTDQQNFRPLDLIWYPISANDINYYPRASPGIEINRPPVTFPDQQPAMQHGKTLVPVRIVFDAMGFAVNWSPETRQTILSNKEHTIVITENSTAFTANGVSHEFDIPVQIMNGRTMVPVRAVLESIGYTVDWDGARNAVIVTMPQGN